MVIQKHITYEFLSRNISEIRMGTGLINFQGKVNIEINCQSYVKYFDVYL